MVGPRWWGTATGCGRAPASDSVSVCTYPQRVSTCTHRVDAAPADLPLRCGPVAQTPIYDQLRDERINADVPATGADPPPVGHPGKHRLLGDGPSASAVTGPPGPGAALDTDQHDPVGTDPAGQPADDGQRAAAGWGPRATLSSATHTRQAPTHGPSEPLRPATGHNPAARHAAADAHGAPPEKGSRPRQAERTEPRPAAPAGVQFQWFSVDHDVCY